MNSRVTLVAIPSSIKSTLSVLISRRWIKYLTWTPGELEVGSAGVVHIALTYESSVIYRTAQSIQSGARSPPRTKLKVCSASMIVPSIAPPDTRVE